MIQIFIPTQQERNYTEAIEKANKYIWMILKSNGIRDNEIGYRVRMEKDEQPFVRHIFIDGCYYTTVAPVKYFNPFSHFLGSESGFYHYYNNAMASKKKK